MTETNEREQLTFDEMQRLYPDEWLLIGECVLNEATQLVRGVILAHHPQRSVIHKQQLTIGGTLAIVYSGAIAKDKIYLL